MYLESSRKNVDELSKKAPCIPFLEGITKEESVFDRVMKLNLSFRSKVKLNMQSQPFDNRMSRIKKMTRLLLRYLFHVVLLKWNNSAIAKCISVCTITHVPPKPR